MSNTTPWKTTDELVEMIKRKIAIPIYQTTFSKQDIIDFLNEEMMISQVPSILEYHNEYYVYQKTYRLQSNLSRYPIPDRAIGMRLRDIKFVDTNGNYFDLTQIPADDKAFFQRSVGANESIHKFYIEGNDIVLTPNLTASPETGSIAMFFYIRPNQLVSNERAAIISSLVKTITISNNSNIQAVTSAIQINGLPFSPVTSSPGYAQFIIGVDETATATNLAAAINATTLNSYITATSLGPIVTLTSSATPMYWIITNTNCYTYVDQHQLVSSSDIPSNITTTSLVDFLQTRPGHKIYTYDISPVNVSTNIIFINDSDMPNTFTVGDYICVENECIIPYLPPDLHNALAERASTRILAAQGDAAGLQMAQAKIQEIDQQTNRIIADRAESTPLKLNARGSILRYSKMGTRRRL